LSACAGQGGLAPSAGIGARAESIAKSGLARIVSPSGGKIQHIIYIIQENRSFNFMFDRFPGALTQDYGYDENGNKIALHSQAISTGWDIDHSANGFFAAYDNGKLDGWNTEYACCGEPKNFAYAYARPQDVKTYWQMAEQYVLADHFFQSNIDGSFIAHQYAIAAYANHEVNFPSSSWSCLGGGADVIPTLTQNRTYGPNVPVCEDYPTVGDRLDDVGVSWKSYTYSPSNYLWDMYAVVKHIYEGADYAADVEMPANNFIKDVASGKLAGVTWITPTYTNSDHAGSNSTGGQAWVSSLVNAVGESQFWNSSAIFIIWDDWGGWFDPVAPVYLDYDGTGFRLPMIAISPYAKTGYVSHVQYESSSVLRFMEDNFGVAPLAASDSRAADPAYDAFDFAQKPRPFVPFTAPPALKVHSDWQPGVLVDGD
jgi:phospholipase C